MFYREAGQFKSDYAADQAMFPIPQDRYVVIAILAFAFLGVPLIANEYWLQAILIPFLVFSMAAIGLNLLTGYAGQLSLGTGGFMAVGGYMTYKFTTFWPELNIVACLLLSGLCARPGWESSSEFRACASRASISRWPRLPRSSFSCGPSTRCPGSTTTTLRAR